MTIPSSSFTVILIFIIISLSPPTVNVVNGLGSAATMAVTYGTATVCGIIAAEPNQRIQCYRNSQTFLVQPNTSFEAISGGQSFFCGLKSGGSSLFCWDTGSSDLSFIPKRIYHSENVTLTDLTVGDAQVCAREVKSGVARCWRGSGSKFQSPGDALRFGTITSGGGFSCGILKNSSRVLCWGSSSIGTEIQRQFGNLSMSTLVAGESHVCGLTMSGSLVCKGRNDYGQLDVPSSSAYVFSGLALGANFSCAIRLRNGLVVCWGGKNRLEFDSSNGIENVSFEFIVAGLDFACGLTTSNLSMICWGPGWANFPSELPLAMIIPGPCVQSSCNMCGTYPNSETLCDGSGNICKSCQIELPLAMPLPPVTPSQSQPVSPPSKARNRVSLAVIIVGSAWAFAGICTIIFCLWTGVCGFLRKENHNSVQPTAADQANADTASVTLPNAPISSSYSSKSLSLPHFRRQRSGSSISSKTDKIEVFWFSELATATNNFSLGNKIGAGSFGTVYKGKLVDGREVAIKRGESSVKVKKSQEKDSAFDSELALLSRLHHRHLVGLVGFCEEKDERLLVYEYMSNGALHDHLHSKNNTEKSSSILNSWKMRIRIALETARGIDYLHNYAVPPIIHRDIKSSNILLNANWTARVSDFGLSLMGPESENGSMPTKAVGTVGYIDPEYYVLNVLTAKSDVYGLGVVLFELLTGKRAVFKNEEDGTAGPVSVVEYARPLISAGELQKVLDERAGLPEANEAEAVQLVAYTAMHCVNLEGRERPSISEIVANLERALALCEYNPGSLSPSSFFIHSE